mgnify:FL=1
MATKRKISNEKFLKNLTEGEYKDIIDFASQRENELDVQIRDNYLNIYYQGGNLLRVHPRSLYFDEFYFHRGAKDMRKTHLIDKCKKGDKACIARWEDYKNRRKEMLDILKERDMATYCKEMKRIMKEWEADLHTIGISHDEKYAQQQISMNNRGATDYTVVDLEYAVSTTSNFKYNGDSTKKVPRFDLIAVDKSGQLYVIELKTGLKAIDGNSGIRAHMDCFKHSIGSDSNNNFINEMDELLEQKQKLKLIEKDIRIDSTKKPQFIFAFSDEPGKNQYKEFVEACKERGYNDEVIYVDNDYQLNK